MSIFGKSPVLQELKKLGKEEETGRELSGNKVERNAGAEDPSEDISEFEKGIWKSI